MTDLIRELPDIQGCYLLTPTGTLGRYRPDRRFHPDPELTQALAGPIDRLLQEIRSGQDTRWLRLGILHADRSDKPWKTATLALADDVLRRLYPVASVRDGRMTSFQLRHREHGVFRGMQLLLDYRDPAVPDIPFFCPVLVYRGTTLDHYLPWPERPPRDTDRQTVAVEVIDLLAGLARSQRNVPAVVQLVVAEREALVRPELRQAPRLGIIDDVRSPADEAPVRRVAAPPAATPVVAGRDPDSAATETHAQAIEEIESRYAANGFRDWDYGAWLETHSTPDSRERIGKLLPPAGGYRNRSADELRFFERFAGLDLAALQLIAAKSPVFEVPTGTVLLDAGTRDLWNLYLLSGDLELAAADGSVYIITGGSPSARQPVAFLKPRLFRVTTRSDAEFLWLYEPMIDAVKRLHPSRFEPLPPTAS